MSKEIMIKAVCPYCGTKNGVSLSFIGKKIICQHCEKIFSVLEPEGRDMENEPKAPASVAEERFLPGPATSVDEKAQVATPPVPALIKLALVYKFIDKDQCMKFLSDWKQAGKSGRKTDVEALCRRSGWLSEEQIRFLNVAKTYVDIKKRDKVICSLALKKGFVLPADATWAMDVQAKQFREKRACIDVGDILIRAEALSKNEYQVLLKAYAQYAESHPEAAVFQEIPQDPPHVEDGEPEKNPIQINVSQDKLRAYLTLTSSGKGLQVSDVKAAMAAQGILHGIVEDKLIESFIVDWAEPDKRFKVAEGVYPVYGENAYIRFMFDVDHLKAGTAKEGGGIDYKDRGVIPYAKKGDILAEKMPLKPGTVGMDVYGCKIEVEDASDIDIIAGKGVTLAEDKAHVFADTDGYPNVHLGQVVNVYPGIDIDGDVGYETGHVIFDGHVNVAGSVKEGFKVKATGLFAEEIVGAEIDVSGDVVVRGGIIGAAIRTQGSVRAMYIRNATVSSYGNVVVEKQISDSTISTSGACHVVHGLIVTSDISAKKGIRVKDAGTDVSAPNRLRVGLDRNVELEVEKIKKRIADKNALKDALVQEIQKIDDGLKSVYNVIAEMAHFQDRILQKKAGIMETIEKFDKKAKKRRLVHGEKALEEIEAQITSNDQTMNRLFATQNAYQEKIVAISEKQNQVDGEIIECDIERKAIVEWSNREKGDATITVYGAIRDKTVIYGIHSSRVLSDTYKNVRIKEVRIHDPDSTLTHEIRVYDSSGISR